ncbi:uncharacterized protein LOC129319999 isoform X2 [Prosopis cineraria]|nr:uncharacterized protein LOC129319999 isoform X2 [Prosopis cineraria]XP_054821100.1 uncharacterized protein LOC129319999 isoform X2 [Prosopis cineraria]
MGCRSREFFSDDSSSSLCEALLFATMCIIGLPVDVHVKNGSVYSGIFHTASADKDYSIILKKARMIKKGKGDENVGKEGLIDTLVIQSDDLVQVVAKGVMLPADGVSGNMTGNDEEAAEHTASSVEKPEGSLMDDKMQVNESRQDGDDMLKGQTGNCKQKFGFAEEKIVEKVQGHSSSPEMDACPMQVGFAEHGHAYMTAKSSGNGSYSAPESVKANDRCCEKSNLANFAATDAAKVGDHASELHNISAKSVLRSTESIKNAKEFKLNPDAKVFSPSFVNPISVTPTVPPVPTVANMAYLPNSSSVVPIAAIQSEVGFNTLVSRPSLPVKVAQYGNLTAANGGSGSQFTQPIVGQLTHRTQPLRFAAHYNPVLSEPTYLQPSCPAVVVGRSGQLVYVHPVTHDLVHGAMSISPVSPRPLLNMNHVQFPKQQGGTMGQVMPFCVPPPVLANGQQPCSLQNHNPVLQPSLYATRPIPVLGPNGFYGTKF